MDFETVTTRVTVKPAGKSTFDEMSTNIEIMDEGAGEFVEVSRVSTDERIKIDPDEWPFIRSAIDSMVKKCKGD